MSGWLASLAHLPGPPLLVALAAFGLLVGVLTGLFGVGGGFLVVPMLNLLFGIEWNIAIGSSLAFTIGTGAGGAARHARLGNVEPRATLIIGSAAVVGAVAGATLLQYLKTVLGRSGSEGFNLLVESLFIALLLVTAYVVGRRAGDERKGPTLLQRLPLGPRTDLRRGGPAGVSLTGLCLVGLAVGVLTGLLGVGGGVLLVPILILVVGLRPHQAVGTSLGVVLFGSIAGTIKHGMVGNVSLALAMPLLVGSSVGIQIGAWVCERLHGRRLRQYFAIIVLVAAAAVACNLAAKLARR
jgi:uncharacterized membrane protein YfcA